METVEEELNAGLVGCIFVACFQVVVSIKQSGVGHLKLSLVVSQGQGST